MAIFITEAAEMKPSKKMRDDFHEIISQLTDAEDFNDGFDIDNKRLVWMKIYYDGQKPVGFGMWDKYRETGIGTVLNFATAILKEYRGKGLGRKIGQEAVEVGLKHNGSVRLYWGARKDNVKSIALAKSLGFEYLSEYDGYVCYCIYKNGTK